MMTNLFSVFDPSSSLVSSAWLVLLGLPLLVKLNIWKILPAPKNLFKTLLLMLKKEVSFSLGKSSKGSEILILLVFTAIFLMNFPALYPQVFSVTSHLTMTLPLSLVCWLSIFFFGWFNNTGHMLVHLVPQGTPPILMPFMVLIELTSNLIRPITLCVRLTANLIAGHLLMVLLGNFLTSLGSMSAMLLLGIPLALTILESAVAMIQAYVFVTLVTLYMTETK